MTAGWFTQNSGTTRLDNSTLNAPLISINGGTLFGNGGTITGNFGMAGTIHPGDAPNTAGALHIIGNYIQTAAGRFNLSLGGLGAGTQFSLLTVSGMADLNGTLNIGLINGFFPTVGNTFTFLTAGGGVSSVFSTINGLNIGRGEELMLVYNPNNVEIETIVPPTSDSWLGGTDVWSNAGKWSLGTVPGANNDMVIYSGVANDLVTLNVGSSTINSLTLGGVPNGFTSELTDGGVKQTLTITNALNIGQTGILDFTGSGSLITAGSIANNGSVTIGAGATLNLTNQPNGITDVVASSSFDLAGTFNAGANNGFYKLTSAEGSLTLENGQVTSDTPISGTLTISNTGAVYVLNNSTLQVNGNLDNFGTLVIDPSTLTITGTLTNNVGSTFSLAAGDILNAGSVNNLGSFTLPGGTQLNTPMFSSMGSTTVSSLATLLVGTGTAPGTGYVQLANGTLAEMIAANNQFGVINVNGSALLDGTLDILLQGGYNPAVGKTYKFLLFNSGQLSGIFGNIENDLFNGGTEKWLVNYDSADGYVELIAEKNSNPVPEPSTLLVLIPGLLAAGYGLRRLLQ